jgi:hypothetical protein
LEEAMKKMTSRERLFIEALERGLDEDLSGNEKSFSLPTISPPSLSVPGSALLDRGVIGVLEPRKPSPEHKESMMSDPMFCTPRSCRYCGWVPCFMDTHYDSMMVLGTELEEHGVEHKSIRYSLYREMALKFYGKLGSRVRKKLPTCIVGEIRDAYPKKTGEDYTGFRPGPK